MLCLAALVGVPPALAIKWPVAIGGGLSYIEYDLKGSLPAAASFSLVVGDLYLEYNSNFARGHGKKLYFLTENTRLLEKIEMRSFNIGCRLPFDNGIYLLPHVGLAFFREIYQDATILDHYFYGKTKYEPLLAWAVGYEFSERVSAHLSVGNIEKVKFGLNIFL